MFENIMPYLRTDQKGDMSSGWIGGLIMLTIAIFVFLALLPSIAYQVSLAQANASVDATADVMLGLVVLLLVVACILLIVGFARKGAE